MSTLPGPDGLLRCEWALAAPSFLEYHDTEWGFPEGNNQRLFEKICLEAFQSGLSWRTILDKRENFRAAFKQFNPQVVAAFTEDDVERLMQNAGIVRNRAKINAAINNAKRMLELAQTSSLANVVWNHEPPRRVPAGPIATSPESVALAKELKRRGWNFMGPTTAYAFMQAMGLVNDHAADCTVRERAESARESFTLG